MTWNVAGFKAILKVFEYIGHGSFTYTITVTVTVTVTITVTIITPQLLPLSPQSLLQPQPPPPQKGFAEYVAKEDPDVLCLNETKISVSNGEATVLPNYPHRYFVDSVHNKGYAGVGYGGHVVAVVVIVGVVVMVVVIAINFTEPYFAVCFPRSSLSMCLMA